MGEENLKDFKTYMIYPNTGEKKQVMPVIGIKWVEVANANIDKFNEQVQKECENFAELQKEFAGVATTLEFNLKDFQESTRIFMKLFGLTPITKKRARKLLMSHGYDRNSANSIISRMKNRNQKNLWEYFYL